MLGAVKGDKMVVLMTMDVPVSREDAEVVSAAMGPDDPPKGLIAHVMTKTPDGVRVVDIWESQEDFQRFNKELLLPTMQRVLDERGISLYGPPPEPTFEEAFDLVRGRHLSLVRSSY
jgi:heme-degrading monooxygenase HmoA